MTISYGLCWNIDSRKIIWPPRAHFGSENESLKGLRGSGSGSGLKNLFTDSSKYASMSNGHYYEKTRYDVTDAS